MKLILKNILVIRIIAIILFTLVITTSVYAASTYSVPGDFETIQEAIDVSSIGYYRDEK